MKWLWTEFFLVDRFKINHFLRNLIRRKKRNFLPFNLLSWVFEWIMISCWFVHRWSVTLDLTLMLSTLAFATYAFLGIVKLEIEFCFDSLLMRLACFRLRIDSFVSLRCWNKLIFGLLNRIFDPQRVVLVEEILISF